MSAQLAQCMSTLCAALLADVTKLDQGLMVPNGTNKLLHTCALYTSSRTVAYKAKYL